VIVFGQSYMTQFNPFTGTPTSSCTKRKTPMLVVIDT